MPGIHPIVIRELSLELNGGCNLKCSMCPQETGREKDFLKKLPLGLFQKIIDDGMQYGLQTVSLHGSGEPTLNRNMPDYVRYVKSKGLRCITLTNGLKLTEQLSGELIDAGIDMIRISATGHDRASYHKWMSADAFDLVRENVRRFAELNRERGGHTQIVLYHLITEPGQEDLQLAEYRANWLDYTGVQGEVWKMHNWAGQYDAPYRREGQLRSCGRPLSPILYVRAGGQHGRQGAVVPCCFVLGQDSHAVLGHLDTQSIRDVLEGDRFNQLRLAHRDGRFDELSYCKNCDQLLDAPESLVWTDIPGKKYGQQKADPTIDFRDLARDKQATA
jgi:uncharacterized Fe-S cluster-containing radical SAM superfamily protein